MIVPAPTCPSHPYSLKAGQEVIGCYDYRIIEILHRKAHLWRVAFCDQLNHESMVNLFAPFYKHSKGNLKPAIKIFILSRYQYDRALYKAIILKFLKKITGRKFSDNWFSKWDFNAPTGHNSLLILVRSSKIWKKIER